MNELLERYRVPIVGALSLLLLAAAGIILLRRPTPEPIEIVEPSPTPEPTPAPVAVYVTGAVVNPGVYYLPQDSRVEEAVRAAGGPAAEADLNRVNLAQRVHDEEQIYVPEIGEQNPPVPPDKTSSGGLVNVNTASATELQTLPGIGPTLAQSILDHREAHGPFGAIEEIMDVRGIGEGLFAGMRDLITVE